MTTTTTPHAQEAAVHLPLTLLTPSPTNPRKRFNQDKIDELAASITKHGGVFQPILARRNPAATDTNGQPPFEIIAGERRWRASKQANMASVLALVREITDFDALEIQLLENIDREDLHPLEEADGLHKLLREPNGIQGYATAEELAQRIGKSRRWVFQRLALLNLCDAAREAFLADTINASVAGLIARMPDPANQAEATKRIVQGFGGEPYSFRAAAEYLHKEFMLSLAKAKFDITAPYQCAGPCAACPKRSGAAPDLFAELNSGDMCQDSKCYDAKTEEAHQLLLQAARDAGQQVFSGDDARMVMPSPRMLPAGHQWLDKPCPELTDSKRTLLDIIGATHKHIMVLDHPYTETVIHLVPTTTVKQVLKAKGLLREAEQPSAQAAAPAAPPDKARPVLKPQPLSPSALQAHIETRHGEKFSALLFKRLHDALASATELPLIALRMLIMDRMDNSNGSYEAFALLYDTHGWERPDQQRGFPHDLERRLGLLDGRALGELLIETLLVEQLSNAWTLDDLETYDDNNVAATMATHFKIDLDVLDAQAYDAAAIEVKAEETKRLNPEGTAPVLDATDAFVASASAAATQPKSAIKYRNAMTGETWSGRGLMPKWLKVRLEEGHTLADFDTTAAKVPA